MINIWCEIEIVKYIRLNIVSCSLSNILIFDAYVESRGDLQ